MVQLDVSCKLFFFFFYSPLHIFLPIDTCHHTDDESLAATGKRLVLSHDVLSTQ